MSSFKERLRLGANAPEELEAFCRARSRVFYQKTDVGDCVDLWRVRRRREATATAIPLVSDLCERFFGKLPAQVTDFANSGTFHSVYRITIPGDDIYICRISLVSERPAFEFLNDAWADEVLSRKPAPAVPVSLIDLTRDLCPFDYEILGAAKGRSLKSIEDEATQFTPPHLLRDLGRVAALVHEVETEGFGLLDVRPISEGSIESGKGLLQSWREYVWLNLEVHVQACVGIGAVTAAEAAKVMSTFKAAADILDLAPSRLLHGDLGAHNVFSDGERVTALIDWEDALCGDPVFDIAYWGTFGRDSMREYFLEGYQSTRALPADFERRYWLYFLRIALSKTVHRHHFGYADRPGRPSASLRIQKALERLASLG